jgi:hypothetical protein
LAFKNRLRVGLGLAQSGNPIPGFPLTAFLQNLKALKTFEHIPFSTQGGRRAETAML